jgi:SAM-dependent methyltransferase
MAQRIYSPRKDELPPIVDAEMTPVEAKIFRQADGTRSLREIIESCNIEATDFREAINNLTSPKRQLIKFTRRSEDLSDPFCPCNTVPRNFYHASRWGQSEDNPVDHSIIDFHLRGIEDASWEFDLIEPTINHAFRFPSEALGGLDYGARFCMATLKSDLLPLLHNSAQLQVLEVGGGTGSFARSFIDQARSLKTPRGRPLEIKYQIMDLSPSLIQSQRQKLADVVPAVMHFQQDATNFNLPNQKIELIIANEVIADFPVAWVERKRGEGDDLRHSWEGEGARDLEKYGLDEPTNGEAFLVNAGVFRFIERAWEHLSPGGVVIMSEYGRVDRFPAQSYHLNHEEFSIHFGHVQKCARKVGFECRLLLLKDFLEVDDQVLMLDGQEEQIQCLNYVFQKHGSSLPYALISRNEFQQLFQGLVDRIGLTGFSFSPLASGFHYGPRLDDFMVLIMTKPG